MTRVSGLKISLMVATAALAAVAAWLFLPAKQNAKASLAENYQREPTPFPDDNPFTIEKLRLGKSLFFDRRLSATGKLSCASCHDPGNVWQSSAAQHKKNLANTRRKAPSLENVAWGEEFTWDGRAKSLEAQILIPLFNPLEMATSETELLRKLNQLPEYKDQFATAFPGQPVTITAMRQALATFERTIASKPAPFDRWIAGDEQAISEIAKVGFRIFTGKGLCSRCHRGWRLTDDGYHDTGLPSPDIGRFTVQPKIAMMKFAFKTPGLRNIAHRQPYMHDGSLSSLEEVVKFYNSEFIVRPSLSPEMKRLHLSDREMESLVAFMKTLTSDDALTSDQSVSAANFKKY